ncbi:Aminodeoxychorismate synthase component 2 [bioreactor metagenome]|uniref:Aminodeoxychorismate synthase component 2 n=1 Tax=bioreactor metagenome TaxID=1076179 RepID=A0A644W4H4_9ZZZZ|nr:aminodeoxychorismate/anthranilate synthase component II [Negativicutes bacterium]
MILLIDNYDSFVYNIYQYCGMLGHQVCVVRNDQYSLDDIDQADYSTIIISPGPGTPKEAGISKTVIARFSGEIPILGICLGHQAIGEVFGGSVVRAPQPVHGKTADIYHNGQGIYRQLPRPFTAGRYHSLVVDHASLPDCLEITATSGDGLIMGLRHREYDVEGIQFHPESILTSNGFDLLGNFLAKVQFS